MTQSNGKHGIILLAHGSRDPLWRQPVEAVARHIGILRPDLHVRCAYLELSAPDLDASVAELLPLGVESITVVPLFLGIGKHAREDMPRLMAKLRVSHPQILFILRPSIGEEAQVLELIARIAIS
ncbi:MAG: cobalamin biosynthesis protein CbiX [Comamonadaceae bacterium]|nr:MAG: cobalamin biosynthesis protein CbiX [Comamonadaceae bacterium]